tara:strand:- start:945 stop:1304 length:360 start_codon:yes stop_codon:yes gene_type:complete
MTKEDKFNPERLLRSLGFTSVIEYKDDKTGDWKTKPRDWGTSRFYDHPLGYRVDITYDDNTMRKPDNIVYYMFRDNQHGFHPSSLGTTTAGHLSMDWWLSRFNTLGWDIDMMKEHLTVK